jgi:hypothetical protein
MMSNTSPRVDEFLVAADVIRTVAIRQPLRASAFLSIIVLIRTFLRCSLELEITGQWPWEQMRTLDRPKEILHPI